MPMLVHKPISCQGISSYRHITLMFLFLFFGFGSEVSAQTSLGGFTYPFDSPCRAFVYDFKGGAENNVPCGPSANTTPSVEITRGGQDSVALIDTCNGGAGAIYSDILWVTFIIQEGGSFEWQTVPGAEKFYYELWYSKDSPSELNNGGECNNLGYLECGRQFTGWKVQSTPNPLKRWRFYLAFYFHDSDKDLLGDGVVKIRKSCGGACLGAAVATFNHSPALDTCINPNDQISLTTSGTMPGPQQSWFIDSEPLDLTISQTNGNGNTVATAMPSTNTTYYFVVVGNVDPPCPAIDSVFVQVDNCCDALAGDGPVLPDTIQLCQGDTRIDNGMIFSPSSAFASTVDSALILTDMSGVILDSTLVIPGTFSKLSSLSAGMYFIYSLSYGAAGNISDYLASKTNISEIESDQESGVCLDLKSWGRDYKINVFDVGCGVFPWTSSP